MIEIIPPTIKARTRIVSILSVVKKSVGGIERMSY